jgi:HK97 family phage portal protein
VAVAIALEIGAEEFGASFFSNGALPLMLFKYMQGSAGFKTAEAERQFIEDFQRSFGGNNRHRAMLLPKGIEAGNPIEIQNDKNQMLESRKYQRTVIAGAFGVPPHLVGDLERATFNNVEQQDSDFTSNVIQPVAQAFESAMERDLLTDDDYNNGICIRFNLDSILRADFKSRQEGSRIQRDAGVISSNEWREREGLNPISDDDGGDDYMRPANMLVAGEPVPVKQPAAAPDPNEKQ